jgi:cysteine desulfurase
VNPGGAVDLDHAATTRLRPEARAAMAPFLDGRYGNPSGGHALARDAMRAVDEARERVADALGCRPGEVVFTSGGTEADVHAVSGGLPPRPGIPVCSAVEHHAVLDPVLALGGRTVAVDRWARLDLDDLADVLADCGAPSVGAVSVVSVMAANNEVGTIVDLDGVAAVVREHAPGTPLHTDAVQAASWLPAPAWAAADLVSVSAHKFGGPKGVGALVVRGGTRLGPLLPGGGQERGRRSGTTNVAGVVGMAAALASTVAERDATAIATRRRRDRLADRLTSMDGVAETVGVARAGGGVERSHLLPSICHVTVDGVGSEELLFLLDDAGVRASAASSCASGAASASHVLAAIGVDVGPGRAALRLSLGPDTTDGEVERAADVIAAAVDRVRDHRPPAQQVG